MVDWNRLSGKGFLGQFDDSTLTALAAACIMKQGALINLLKANSGCTLVKVLAWSVGGCRQQVLSLIDSSLRKVPAGYLIRSNLC